MSEKLIAGKLTVPFFRIDQAARDQIRKNLNLGTSGDRELTVDRAKTAIEAAVGPDSKIAGEPMAVSLKYGYGFYIPLSDQEHPAFVSLATLQTMVHRQPIPPPVF